MSAIISLFFDQGGKAAVQDVKTGTALKQALVQSHERMFLEKENLHLQVKITKFLFSSATW